MTEPLELRGVGRSYRTGDGDAAVLREREPDAAAGRDRGAGGAVRHR